MTMMSYRLRTPSIAATIINSARRTVSQSRRWASLAISLAASGFPPPPWPSPNPNPWVYSLTVTAHFLLRTMPLRETVGTAGSLDRQRPRADCRGRPETN